MEWNDELARSENQKQILMQTAFDVVASGVFWITEQGRFIGVNKKACEWLGYPEEELMGLGVADVDQNCPRANRAAYWGYLKEKGELLVETTYRTARGKLFPVEVTSRFIKIEDKGYEIACVEDVSEKRSLLRGLRSSEERFRGLLQNLNEGVWVFDKNSVTNFVNSRMLDMLGYSFEEMLGKSLFFFVKIGDEVGLKDFLKKRFDGQVKQCDLELVKKDGSHVFVIMEMSPILDEEGMYAGGIAGIMDITKRKLLEIESERSRQKLLEQKIALEQKNLGLKEVLFELEQEKKRIKDNVVANVEAVLLPMLKKIKLKGASQKYVSSLEKGLRDDVHPFGHTVAGKLTGREIEICNLIKEGLSTKEIAGVLNLSKRTVDFHRDNIRKKFGLKVKGGSGTISAFLLQN